MRRNTVEMVCTNRLSLTLIHMSGTCKTIGTVTVKCVVVRCVTLLTRYRHPGVGQILLMTGTNLLGGCTCTSEVSQRSLSGQGIMGVKTCKGMLLCMLYSDGLVVVHVSGECSLVTHRVNVSHHNDNLLPSFSFPGHSLPTVFSRLSNRNPDL